MSDARNAIRKALLALIARRDASVFKDADIFENTLKSAGNWQDMPEITALKAGLIERLPWELQKDSNGTVSAITITKLVRQIMQKHGLNQDVASWAVETWAVSLGLKPEMPKQTTNPSMNAKPATLSVATQQAEPVQFTEPDTGSARLGVIFGTDESGIIRVYKSWFDSAPQHEAAKYVAAKVAIEPRASIPLFTAAPKKKQKAPVTTQKIPTANTSNDPNAKKTVKQTKADQINKTAVNHGRQTASAPKPANFDVNDTSPEALLARATLLLPGGGGKVDVKEALGLLKLAVKKGSLEARRKFGEIYLKGIGVKENLPNAANWFKSAAELGDVESQYQLGSLYQCGIGVSYNLEMAQLWLQRAAENGHEGAKELLKQILQA
ncbi:MAG: hypothetical protein Kow0029_03720 [Candidatus Rifleibacteriota bacterium]